MPRNRSAPPRVLVVALLVALVACGDEGGERATPAGGADAVEGTVTVFAAASLTDVFTDLAAAFEAAHPEATVALSFGPSSGLVTQITEGAPADVIATADTSPMDDLAEAEALRGPPTAFATNALELAVPPGNPGEVTGIESLADDDLVVGLCNKEVPCGHLAREALTAAGVSPSIDTDEEDVRALLTKVAAGEVDVGVVYRTDVVAAGDAVEGIEISGDEDVVATYPIATVEGAANVVGAEAFIALVVSPEGRRALAEAGFSAP